MLLCTGMSSTGPVKSVNQDAYVIKRAQTLVGDIVLAVVADGMGGLSCGQRASGTLVRAFDGWFQHDLPLTGEALGFSGDAFSRALQLQWANLLQEINLSLLKQGAHEKTTMGTACSVFLIAADVYYVMQVGDTRLYCVGEQDIYQITKDQTFSARELAAGHMTRQEAACHPLRNTLLQCVGATPNLAPVFSQGTFEEQSSYLLCSDGFYHLLTSAEMIQTLNAETLRAHVGENEPIEHLQAYLQTLMDVVAARGQRDNATLVVVAKAEEFAKC